MNKYLNDNSEPEVTVGTAPKGDSWIRYSQRLQFTVGQLCLWEIKVPGVILDIPFMELTTDMPHTLPRWEEFPSEAQVAVVHAKPTEGDLSRMILLSNSIRYVMYNENRYYINLQGTFQDYLKKFSAKSRYNLHRNIRKFAEFSGGMINWQEFRTPQEMVDFLECAHQVSKKTYQEKIGLGLPNTHEFHEEVADLASRDVVRAYILFHGAQPIAYIFCPSQKNNLIYQHLGYDPAFRAWSPGDVLLYLMLERLFAEERFLFLDFEAGAYDYKKFFSTDSSRCARIVYFRRTLRNLFLLIVHASLTTFSVSAGKVLHFFRLKSRVKNLFQFLQLKKLSARR